MRDQPPLRLPGRPTDGHKGTFGRILLIGGSRGMTGSIAMSSVAALKTGAGLVSAVVPDRCLESVAAIHPCLMTIAADDGCAGRFSTSAWDSVHTAIKLLETAKRRAIGVGPGMTTEPGSVRIIEQLMHTALPRVIDADGLNCLAKLRGSWQDSASAAPDWSVGHDSPIVLTPHPGELARLIGAPVDDREAQIEAAARFCCRTGVVMVVKGGPTIVVDSSRSWINTTGNPGMATGGSGDVLTGVITALLGQGFSGWDAARLGVWMHGLAGDLAAKRHGQASMTAVEILDALPEATVEASE